MSDELVPKHYQHTDSHIDTQKQTKRLELVIRERKGGWEAEAGGESERERAGVEPKSACDGDVMRLNRVPTGQLTSASASLTNPPGPFMPRPDANKENQGEHTQTHIQTDFVFMTTP